MGVPGPEGGGGVVPGHEWKQEVGKACFYAMLICDPSFGAFCRGVFSPIVSIEEGNRSVGLGWLDGDNCVLFVRAVPGSFFLVRISDRKRN